MRVDFHVHTEHSHDSWNRIPDVLTAAEEAGLDAIAITDHDTIDGIERAVEAADEHELEVIPGVERTVPTEDHGVHLICLFVDTLPDNENFQTLVRDVCKQNGYLIVPHPFRKKSGLLAQFEEGTVSRSTVNYVFNNASAVEAINWKDRPKDIQRNLSFIKEGSWPIVAGTDAHIVDVIGSVQTAVSSIDPLEFDASIEAKVTEEGSTLDDIASTLAAHDVKTTPVRDQVLSTGARLCNMVPGAEPNRTGKRLLKRFREIRYRSQTSQSSAERHIRIERHTDTSLEYSYIQS